MMESDNEQLGLENLGNTCFMNSALQCLSRTKSLIPQLQLFGSGNRLVLHVRRDENGDQVSVLCQNGGGGDGDGGEEELGGGGNSLQNSFKISMVIPTESMTGRLKKCFLTITGDTELDSRTTSTTASTSKHARKKPSYYGFRPHEVHNMIAKHFRPGAQHDAHELLRTVVDFMKKDQTRAFRVAIMKHFGVAKNGDGSDPRMVELVKSLDQNLKHKTFIDEIFGGELMTTQTCLSCLCVKRSHEEFLDLSLPIRVIKQNNDIGNTTKPTQSQSKKYSLFDDDENIVINRKVQDCLRAFTEPAILTGSNMVECENCHKLEMGNDDGKGEEDLDQTPLKESPKNENHDLIELAKSYEQGAVNPEYEPRRFQPNLNVQHVEDDFVHYPEDDYKTLYPPMLESAEDDEDSDLPPALEGIGGSISDQDEEDSSSEKIKIDLHLPAHDKFEYFQLQDLSSEKSPQDEGYSEGENSASLELAQKQNPSASSSRNSISDPDEKGASASAEPAKAKDVVVKKVSVKKCPCSRQQNISRPPEFLTIHLKRFQISNRGNLSKVNEHVEFPMSLDLTPYCVKDDTEEKDIFDEDGKVMYRLYGIVEHSGNLHWGHYVAYVRVPGKVEVEKEEPERDAMEENASSGKEEKADLGKVDFWQEEEAGKEGVEDNADPESMEEKTVTESMEEKADPEIMEENTNPKSMEEKVGSEKEGVEKKTNPESMEEKSSYPEKQDMDDQKPESMEEKSSYPVKQEMEEKSYPKTPQINLDDSMSSQTDAKPHTTPSPSKWYYISDSHVSRSSERAVKKRDPYILFYERVRGSGGNRIEEEDQCD